MITVLSMYLLRDFEFMIIVWVFIGVLTVAQDMCLMGFLIKEPPLREEKK